MWGYPIDNVAAYWGARALYSERTNYIDLLPDRQSYEGPASTTPEGAAFCKWIDTKALPWLRKIVKQERPAVNSDKVYELVEGDFVMRASCNGSFGYMYIGVAKLAGAKQEVTHGS